MQNWLKSHLDDLLLFSGEGVIIYATWLINPIAALYVGGFFLMATGVMVGLGTRGKA